MAFSRTYSRADIGLDAPLVTVETHLSPGLPGFNLVGLPETAVRESRARVRSALLNSGFKYPKQRITVNLAPADMPKRGGRHDLAIAVGILTASGQLPAEATRGTEFLGELELSGQLRAVRGCTAATLACRNKGRTLALPSGNRLDAARVRDCGAFTAPHLAAVCAAITGREAKDTVEFDPPAVRAEVGLDLADVQGQSRGCRALEIAAAGGHNLLFLGPPGTGKTLLAERLPGLLPPLGEAESLEVASIYSAAGMALPLTAAPPWRAPHHGLSAPALVGGGAQLRPGEISLSHRGVLFLDELPEFHRDVLEALRQPMESGTVTISRANYSSSFPSRFQLVAAMNPCPCGFLGDPERACECSPGQLRRYRNRLSGPLLDRLDLFVELPRPSSADWHGERGPSSATVAERVQQARSRCRVGAGRNAGAAVAELRSGLGLNAQAAALLEKAVERLRLSPRARGRTLKLARTIADLAASDPIGADHLAEALSYRPDQGLEALC